MIANPNKTKTSLLLIACTIAIVALLIIGMTGGTAADKAAQEVEIAGAAVEFVNSDSGVILLAVDKDSKLRGIDRGDEVEIVIEEETEEMENQGPRRWRMRRYPHGGPTTP